MATPTTHQISVSKVTFESNNNSSSHAKNDDTITLIFETDIAIKMPHVIFRHGTDDIINQNRVKYEHLSGGSYIVGPVDTSGNKNWRV